MEEVSKQIMRLGGVASFCKALKITVSSWQHHCRRALQGHDDSAKKIDAWALQASSLDCHDSYDKRERQFKAVKIAVANMGGVNAFGKAYSQKYGKSFGGTIYHYITVAPPKGRSLIWKRILTLLELA